MAKPICVVRLSNEISSGNKPYEDIIDDTREELEKRMVDYHVFVIPSFDMEDIVNFEVFYEKDFTPIQYEELRKLITDSLKEKV